MSTLMRRPWFWLLPMLLASDCGSDGVRSDTRAADSRASADSAGAVVDRGGSEVGTSSDGVAGVSMQVIYNGKSTPVALGTLPPVTLDGESYARLSEVALAALPGTNLDSLVVDFESGDGFRPGTKANCAGTIPAPAVNLAKGYVHLQSRSLRWDDSLAYPGCMAVTDVAKLLLSDK